MQAEHEKNEFILPELWPRVRLGYPGGHFLSAANTQSQSFAQTSLGVPGKRQVL